MKQLFFVGVAVALPVLLASVILYSFFKGIYTVFSDWRLRRELKEIERQSLIRRQQRSPEENSPIQKPIDADPPLAELDS